jgi:hypothetical protein
MESSHRDLPYKGVIVETRENYGLAFCKDLESLIKVNLKKTHLRIGSCFSFSCRQGPDGELEVINQRCSSACFPCKDNIIEVILTIKSQLIGYYLARSRSNG